MKYKGRVAFATGVVLAIAVTLGATNTGTASAAGNTLVVDAGSVLRPVTHVAAGALYGLSSEIKPGSSQLDPLHLNQFTQPPANSLQAGGVGSVPNIKNTMIGAGAQTYERMVDIYPDAPYKWVSWDDWTSKVTTMVNARLADTNLTNVNGWELWNEPDNTWDTTHAGLFTDGWARTYNLVRSLDSITPIVGPSKSNYDHNFTLNFLTAAQASKTVPDVISWHELSDGWLNIQAHINDYRAIETSLGISPRPISINEYAFLDQVDVPHNDLHYMSAFERGGVANADRAFWFEAGTIDGLLYNGAPTGTYWLYKWYGDMAGNMLPVTASGGLDGVASYDSSRKIINVIFAGDAGTNSVNVQNLGALGSTVRVVLSYTPSSGRSANVTAPSLISTTNYTVTGGAITVPVTGMDNTGAYQLVITPQTGPSSSWQQVYEAENATVVNGIRYSSATASNAGYVGHIDGTGDARSDSFIDFIVNAPTTGTYNMSIKYANGGTSPSTQGLAYNGGPWSTVTYPVTGGWGVFGTPVVKSLSLTAGYNVIRLAKGSPGFTGGSGFAELDSITLSQ